VRIAIDCRELVGRPTGVGRYLSELLNAWGDLPAGGAHEFVLCSPERVSHTSFGALRVSCKVSPGSGTLWEQRVLPKLVASAGADVLFSPAYTCPLWCRVPIVLVIHDVSFAAHPEWFSWREGVRRRTLTRMGARRAARVITESDFSKREITRLLGIAPSDIDVIYLGASTLQQPTTTPAARQPIVLFVGSIFNRRHIPELIEGFGRLAARVPEARLELVGDNRTTPRIDMDQLIAGSGVSDRVHWRSYISDADLATLYSTASAFVFLSDYEGFGLTPIEAMAAAQSRWLAARATVRSLFTRHDQSRSLDMATHPAPAPEPRPAPEFPLLAIFAVLIIVAIVPISLVIAAPSTLTLIVALATVAGFAIAVTALLARIIGPEG
jgi:glycosyltransferase involved in cell wall biosynthesis